jgi:hypothetical protein
LGIHPHPEILKLLKAEPNSLFRGKYNLIRIRVSLICKFNGNPDLGATAPRSQFGNISFMY